MKKKIDFFLSQWKNLSMTFRHVVAMYFLCYLKQKLRHVNIIPCKTRCWATRSFIRGEHLKMKGCLKRYTELD